MKLFNRKMSKKQKAALNALADGIECGAKLHPQATGNLVQEVGRNDDYSLKTCALGAALECAWVKQGNRITEENVKAFRSTEYEDILGMYDVAERSLECRIEVRDVDGDLLKITNDANIAGLIWQLNDRALWTREQIAAFLRELE